MKRIFWVLLLSGKLAAAASQHQIDSLIALINNEKPSCPTPCAGDTVRVNHLNALADEIRNMNPDSSMSLCKQALEISEKIIFPGNQTGYQKGIGESYNLMGSIYALKSDQSTSLNFFSKALEIWQKMERNIETDKHAGLSKPFILNCKARTFYNIGSVYSTMDEYSNALGYFFKALKTFESTDDKPDLSSVLSSIGSVYSKQGNYPKALEFYFKSEKLNETLQRKDVQAKNLSSIGNIYFYQKDYTRTLEYYSKAIQLAEETGNKNLLSTFLNNTGAFYYEIYDYKKALAYYLRALKLAEDIGKKAMVTTCITNIGAIYNEQENYPMALEYYLRSLKDAEESGDKEVLASILGNIGIIYTHLNKNEKAEYYFSRALDISTKIGSMDLQKDQHINFSNLYEQTGNYKKALEHFKIAMEAKDSLFNKEKNDEITRKVMNYEFEKKETAAKAAQDKKDAITKKEIENQKFIRNSILGGMSMLISFLIILFFQSTKIAKERKLKEFEQERNRISTELHDDLGSGLTKISLMSQVAGMAAGEKQQLTLQKITHETSDMVDKMNGIIWAMNTKNDSLPNMISFIRKQAYDMFENATVKLTWIAPEQIPEMGIDGIARRNILLVVKEALHNILKYSDAELAVVTIEIKNERLGISVSDNGKGFDAVHLSGNGNGLFNMKKRMEDIKGHCKIISEPGKGATIEIAYNLLSI